MEARRKVSYLIEKTENENTDRQKVFQFMEKLIYEKKNPQYTEGTMYFNVSYEEAVEI